MAHQMSPPQRPMQRPYSPYQQSAHSPPNLALPPAKRARLSPDVSSPQPMNYSPNIYSPYSTPTAGSPTSFNTPQPYASSPPPMGGGTGTMGPPPRPEKVEKEEKEKISDISDISDVIFGSGVDLREEENYMTNTYRNIHGLQSSSSSFNTSFDSTGTIASQNNSFNLLTTQSNYGGHPALAGSGPTSQPVATQESIEQELERKHQDAALAYSRQHEHHLRDPFLQGNTVRHRMHRLALTQGVALDIKGLYEPSRAQSPLPNKPQVANGVTAMDQDGSGLASIRAQSITEAKAHALLDETSRYADILSLVSLAANERIRTLLDEAYTIARGRRYGSHGVAPPDLSDVAKGENGQSTSVVPTSITGTSWDAPAEPQANGVAQPPQPTVSFSSSLTKQLQSLAMADHDAELARIRKRAARARLAASSLDPDAPIAPTAASTPGATAQGTTGPGTISPTPGTPGGNLAVAAAAAANTDAAAQMAPEKPLTKKERERQAKMGQTEEVLHKNANVTAAMALGLGRKGKKYSWMTGGAAAPPVNRYASASAVPKVAVKSEGAAAAGDGGGGAGGGGGGPGVGGDGAIAQPVVRGMQARERRWGSWREDGVEGRGIQVRDWVVVLERDGREKRALQRCLLRLDGAEIDSAGTGFTR